MTKTTQAQMKEVIDTLIEYAKHDEQDAIFAFNAGDYKKQSHYQGRANAFYRAADVVEKATKRIKV